MARRQFWFALAALAAASLSSPAEEIRWKVPLAGNAFQSARAATGQDAIGRRGWRWSEPETVWSVFFHIDRPAVLDLGLEIEIQAGESTIEAKVAGQTLQMTVAGTATSEKPIGRIEAPAGYLRVDLRGLHRSGPDFGQPSHLTVATTTPGVDPVFVRTNDDNMFYWGRRGPSVHLAYETPKNVDIEYAYSELTVPEGGDPVGSFFMANGFGEGYFGIQTKSPTERWVLFSVWSPFKTDNPQEIPESDRIALLAKGEGVKTGEFGNEGSGGQSFLVYPWKTGHTYRFLNSAKPDGQGNTIYTAWISEDPNGPWNLIARFKRPNTNRHLTGFHSFLENFVAENGHLPRISHHDNPWVRDTSGQWHEITTARFTGDTTARQRHRLDYAGGRQTNGFFLKNGGFFNQSVPLDSRFQRPPTPTRQPNIDFAALEKFKK